MRAKRSQAGLTLLEVVVVIAVILLVVMMILPGLGTARSGRMSACLSNLRQIGLAYFIWAEDHGGRLPAAVPISEGGWRELLTNRNAGRYCWTNYVLMQDVIKDPRIFACPLDNRKGATNRLANGSSHNGNGADLLANRNISYFVGVSGSLKNPQAILGGDRNLSPGPIPHDDYGFSPADDSGNDVVLKTGLKAGYCWSKKMHTSRNLKGFGHVVLGDASARVVVSAELGSCLESAEVSQVENATNSSGQLASPGAGIRLVFP